MKLSQKPLQLPNLLEKELRARGIVRIAGVDEAGRGPLAGPVVAACCLIDEETLIEGVNDSKKLSPKKREVLFDQIKEKALYGIGFVDHDLIDEIGISRATHLAMERAVKALPTIPHFILVDGHPVDFSEIPSEGVIRGDGQERQIAAASILAKVTRDRQMVDYDALYPEYGFASHKGYGTVAHREALYKCGRCPIHRKTFSY
ncbi:MAG: Ribonuclease HII [Chlamydiales bacterium]|nr:Ribonuclease HII [Chlamydiales bacterium]MCH9619100.1 Ribonuclease HII [Chlamydiales bacterium]MCH9622362.1 Ribonuclease HII [Chlamydiales bacterium]